MENHKKKTIQGTHSQSQRNLVHVRGNNNDANSYLGNSSHWLSRCSHWDQYGSSYTPLDFISKEPHHRQNFYSSFPSTIKKCWSMPLDIKHPDTPQQLNICRGSTTESHNGPPSHHHPILLCHKRCCYKVQISEVEEDLQATCSSFHQRPETERYSGPIYQRSYSSPTRVKSTCQIL